MAQQLEECEGWRQQLVGASRGLAGKGTARGRVLCFLYCCYLFLSSLKKKTQQSSLEQTHVVQDYMCVYSLPKSSWKMRHEKIMHRFKKKKVCTQIYLS